MLTAAFYVVCVGCLSLVCHYTCYRPYLFYSFTPFLALVLYHVVLTPVCVKLVNSTPLLSTRPLMLHSLKIVVGWSLPSLLPLPPLLDDGLVSAVIAGYIGWKFVFVSVPKATWVCVFQTITLQHSRGMRLSLPRVACCDTEGGATLRFDQRFASLQGSTRLWESTCVIVSIMYVGLANGRVLLDWRNRMKACSDTTFVLSLHVSPSCFVSMFRLLFHLHISSASLLDVSPTFDLQVLCQRSGHVFSQRFPQLSLSLCLHVSRTCHCRFVSAFCLRVLSMLICSRRFHNSFLLHVSSSCELPYGGAVE